MASFITKPPAQSTHRGARALHASPALRATTPTTRPSDGSCTSRSARVRANAQP
jgi:hypothetical protein